MHPFPVTLCLKPDSRTPSNLTLSNHNTYRLQLQFLSLSRLSCGISQLFEKISHFTNRLPRIIQVMKPRLPGPVGRPGSSPPLRGRALGLARHPRELPAPRGAATSKGPGRGAHHQSLAVGDIMMIMMGIETQYAYDIMGCWGYHDVNKNINR